MVMIRACFLALGMAATLTFPAPGPLHHVYEFNDSHFHLTNYVQEGLDIREFLDIMGDKAGRVALFGIPLQQQWSYANSGESAPTYYLQSDAPLYYYSFTDAAIATAYLSLPERDRTRFEPMITGFNPADMYAVDHVKRVLRTFPGVFTGIGEFSIHKEFVTSKIAGEIPSLLNPALDRLLDFCAESGLLCLIHNDADIPFPKPGQAPYLLKQFQALLRRHPDVTVIWAHMGLGRIIQPVDAHAEIMDRALADPQLRNLHIDLSWSETAKYLVRSQETIDRTAALINKYPDRFLFGTDEVAPANQEAYLAVYRSYAPLFSRLSPEALENLRIGNFNRLFDAARQRVRAWEVNDRKSHRHQEIPWSPSSGDPLDRPALLERK